MRGRPGSRPLLWRNILYPEQALTKQAVHTPDAPQAIGTYSQAIHAGNTVYLSGQIGLDPATMQVVDGIDAQVHRVLRNLQAVATAPGANIDDEGKHTAVLSDLSRFARLKAVKWPYLNQT